MSVGRRVVLTIMPRYAAHLAPTPIGLGQPRPPEIPALVNGIQTAFGPLTSLSDHILPSIAIQG